MPELPEVETIRKGLEKTIIGKKIADVEVRLPKIISLGPEVVSNVRRARSNTVEVFRRSVCGQKIKTISRRGKILIIDLEGPFTPSPERHGPKSMDEWYKNPKGMTESHRQESRVTGFALLIHLKLTGQLIFARKGEQKEVKIFNSETSPRAILPHQYTHLIFKFTDGSRLFYNDLRQFGYLRLVSDKDLTKVKELLEYGPEPDFPEFNPDYLLARAGRRRGLTVKQFLMDPKVVAGIGNIYSDEILFWAKLRPTRKLCSLKKQDFEAIVKNTHKVLEVALKAHGSSVEYFFQVNGSEGRYALEHMVYGRAGLPCKVCGKKIESLKLSGRTSAYCPKCQK